MELPSSASGWRAGELCAGAASMLRTALETRLPVGNQATVSPRSPRPPLFRVFFYRPSRFQALGSWGLTSSLSSPTPFFACPAFACAFPRCPRLRVCISVSMEQSSVRVPGAHGWALPGQHGGGLSLWPRAWCKVGATCKVGAQCACTQRSGHPARPGGDTEGTHSGLRGSGRLPEEAGGRSKYRPPPAPRPTARATLPSQPCQLDTRWPVCLGGWDCCLSRAGAAGVLGPWRPRVEGLTPG